MFADRKPARPPRRPAPQGHQTRAHCAPAGAGRQLGRRAGWRRSDQSAPEPRSASLQPQNALSHSGLNPEHSLVLFPPSQHSGRCPTPWPAGKPIAGPAGSHRSPFPDQECGTVQQRRRRRFPKPDQPVFPCPRAGRGLRRRCSDPAPRIRVAREFGKAVRHSVVVAKHGQAGLVGGVTGGGQDRRFADQRPSRRQTPPAAGLPYAVDPRLRPAPSSPPEATAPARPSSRCSTRPVQRGAPPDLRLSAPQSLRPDRPRRRSGQACAESD
uniref:Uncharacterized protein n=1 Tax=uncultured alpha proteobacterium HF0010_30A23 TaxID=710802 RepID=E0XRL3_9PROT|nr:hypothetical protein [uncultured alpha proteobacterium HF0010_30A23]